MPGHLRAPVPAGAPLKIARRQREQYRKRSWRSGSPRKPGESARTAGNVRDVDNELIVGDTMSFYLG